MGSVSKILSPADIRAKKKAERESLAALKRTKAEQRAVLKTARADLKKASTTFGKAERAVNTITRAIERQQEKIASL